MTPLENAIVVSGNHRCGTTWLAEMLAHLPGYAMLFEPLRPHYESARGLAASWRPGPSRKARRPLQRMLMAHPDFCRRDKHSGMFGTPERGVVVKFVRAGRLMPMICAMPIRAGFVIVRDPIDAIASQLRVRAHEKGTPMHPGAIRSVVLQHPELTPVVASLHSPAEWLTAWWCVTYLDIPNAAHVVRYERLVDDPDAELERIFAAIGEPRPPGIDPRAPSHRAKPWAGVHNGAHSTAHQLDRQTRAQIRRVVEGFGLAKLYAEPRARAC